MLLMYRKKNDQNLDYTDSLFMYIHVTLSVRLI